jgi:hypothetical protein
MGKDPEFYGAATVAHGGFSVFVKTGLAFYRS